MKLTRLILIALVSTLVSPLSQAGQLDCSELKNGNEFTIHFPTPRLDLLNIKGGGAHTERESETFKGDFEFVNDSELKGGKYQLSLSLESEVSSARLLISLAGSSADTMIGTLQPFTTSGTPRPLADIHCTQR